MVEGADPSGDVTTRTVTFSGIAAMAWMGEPVRTPARK
jgi:hypothetical protein